MATDPLTVIAESYRGIHESTQVIAQATNRMLDTQARQEATLRGIAWLQGCALVMIGLSLFGLGYLIWQGQQHGQEHAAQTQALLEMVRRLPKP